METNIVKKVDKPKKSVVIPDETLKDYISWLDTRHTLREGAEEIGLNPQALEPIKLRGTCSPATLEKIKKVLYGSQQPA
jgi:hypothetical protein